MSSIHPSAIIDPAAQIGAEVKVAPFAVIHGGVIIGDRCEIGSGAVIYGGTHLGDDVKIFNGASIGSPPQDLKYQGEQTILEIGDRTIVREFCTLNRGTISHGKTSIGADCLIMAYVHIAHDCIIGNNVILVNGVNLGGHIEIDDNAILGGLVAVHQFVKIGKFAFVGGGSLVRKDVPPFIRAAREPLKYVGINSIGLRRNHFQISDIEEIKAIYQNLYFGGKNISEGLRHIDDVFQESPSKRAILDFANRSKRGLITANEHAAED